MGFCYGERTVDVGQTMGLKAPLVWVTPSTSINNYELKAQDRGTFKNSRQGLHSKEWERERLVEGAIVGMIRLRADNRTRSN